MEPLEFRLEKIDVDKDKLIESLCNEKILPHQRLEKLSYLKYNLTDNIETFLRSRGINLNEEKTGFSKKIYSSMNKEPIKRVEYGILNSDGIPDEVFMALTDWEAIYFLAGLWNKKSTPIENKRYDKDLLKRQDVPLIIAETIFTGIQSLRKVQENLRASGKYKTEIKIPYSKEISDRYYSLRTSYMRSKPIQNSSNKPKQPDLFFSSQGF